MKTRMFASLAFAVVFAVSCLGFSAANGLGVLPEPAYAAYNALSATQPDDQDMGVTTQAATKETSTSNATKKPAKPAKAQLKAFKKASADFSLELFGRCVASKGKGANVTIAPMSVLNALAITANGAGGKTARQMRKVLGDGASMTRINKNLRWYNSRLVNVKRARINQANSIWYHNDGTLTMKKKFLTTSKKFYKAEIKPVDFSDPVTVDAINGWVADNTNNMIKRVVDQLDPNDRIAIVNALYFDAEWASPFEKDMVKTRTFTTTTGKKRKVKMMFSTEGKYIEGENVTGFIKPYARGYKYVALLPKKGMSLKKFVSTLDGDTFRKLVASAKKTAVNVGLPKYSLSYSNDGMQEQLAAMGITSAFTEDANFLNMGKSIRGNLYIGEIVHKTKIDLDEQGTKAAAVTGIFMRDNAIHMDVKTVTLNRPFVYAIVDNATNLPVFIGAVNTLGK